MTLDSQILGVGDRRRRAFELRSLDLGKLKVYSPRQTRRDLILHVERIGARNLKLIVPKTRAALGVDEFSADFRVIAGRLH